jgi:hypothetical protein
LQTSSRMTFLLTDMSLCFGAQKRHSSFKNIRERLSRNCNETFSRWLLPVAELRHSPPKFCPQTETSTGCNICVIL